VLFEPNDLRITDGSPTRRRDYLDTMIAQFDSHYMTTLRKYERALFQRNKLLKSPGVHHDVLFPWNVLLSEYGQTIINKRRALVHSLNQIVTEVYQTIAPEPDTISLGYTHDIDITSGRLLHDYESSYERDVMLKTTTVGPHRHDMSILINGEKAADTASRGENRTIVLSLKFIEAVIVEKMTGKKPIILLDDVFSELDDDRQKLLLKEFHDNQVIMTSASTKSRSVRHIVSLS
jgi:DNA replication and repair protein RecF